MKETATLPCLPPIVDEARETGERAAEDSFAGAARSHEARLVELGRLAAMANHELRQPLVGIKAFSEMIGEVPSLPTEVKEWARKIHAQSLRLERIVEGMRNLSRPARRGFERVDVDVLLAEVLGFAAFLFREPNVTLKSTLSAAGACVMASTDELEQVVLNLLANARDAVAQAGGGTVQVASRCEREHVDVYVGDDGPGANPALLRSAREGFGTTKSDGTGLGLKVSLEIAARHGGSLSLVDEAPDFLAWQVRTLFRLRIPLAP